MQETKHPEDWLSIPVLTCSSVTETLDFWEALGFRVTYRQTRPYQYGVVLRGNYSLHFYGVKNLSPEVAMHSGCLIMVSEISEVYQDFCLRLKKHLGKVPHSGLPRISRMKPGTTRFTLTDVSGSSVIFINHGEKDQEDWENAENQNLRPLQKAIALALRFRDYKEDLKAAAATLDVALRKYSNTTDTEDLTEALVIRLDLAIVRNETIRAEECRQRLNQEDMPDSLKKRMLQKHSVGETNEENE